MPTDDPTSELEKSITVALLGADHTATKLVGEAFGTPGTQSDLQFYNRLDSKNKCVFTAVAPIGYPEKIKSLLQTCAMNEIHIMIIDCETGIVPETGEILVAMDIFAKHFDTLSIAVIMNVTASNDWRIEEIQKQLSAFAAATSLKDMPVRILRSRDDYSALKEYVAEIAPLPISVDPDADEKDNYCKVLIDHAFPVKGVGTVVLGVVKKGQLLAGQMFDVPPAQNKIILRSIQKHDRDFKSALPGERVGLALKGIKADIIDRNCVFVTMGTFSLSKEIKVKFSVVPFYKPTNPDGKISPKDTKAYHAIADMAISPIKIVAGDDIGPGKSGMLDLILEKELPHDSHGLRGIIADFGPFEKKLRIVGYFEQQL